MSLKTIFQEGMKERKRKKSLGKVSNEFKEKEKTLAAQMTALGQKAWEAKADISAYPDLQAALGDEQKTLDDLKAQAEQLQKQKQESEEKKKQENDRLAAAQKEMEEKKRKLDKRLDEQKSMLQAAQKETQGAKARLAAIARERSPLQDKMVIPETNEAEKGEITRGLELLAKEEAALQTGISAREDAGKPITALVSSLQEESSQMKKRIDDLLQEQKQVTSELDKKISSSKSDLAKNSEKVREAETKQKGDFRILGEKLAAVQGVDPNLAGEMAAVLKARNEMEGVQAMIGGLERQKDQGQASAYKKMTAILIGGIVLLVAILIALFLLLSPKKKATPLEGLLGREGATTQNLEELAQQMQKGFSGVKAASEKIQGQKIVIASEGTMKSTLPSVSGWQAQEPRYSQGAYGDIETASLQADYAAPDGRSVRVQVTDAGTASALLAGLKMIFAMNIRIDDSDAFQQVATINKTPVVERLDKQDGEATLGIVYKDRYLVELKTRSAKGLELLREFAARLDLSRLP